MSRYTKPGYTVKSNQGPLIVEGFLRKEKRPNARFNFLSKYTTRWFVLDLVNGIFMYKTRKTSKPTKLHPLKVNFSQDIVNVDSAPLLVIDKHIAFIVETKMKVYRLFADSRAIKAMWIGAFFGINNCSEVRKNPRLLKNEVPRSITPVSDRAWLHSYTTASSEMPQRCLTPLL